MRALCRSPATRVDEPANSWPLLARETTAGASSPPAARISLESRCPVLLVPLASMWGDGSAVTACSDLVNGLLAQLWMPRSLRIVVASRDNPALAIGQDAVDAGVYTLHCGLRGGETVRFSARLVFGPMSELLWAESFLLIDERHDRVAAQLADAIVSAIEDHEIEAESFRPQRERRNFALVAQAERALTNLSLPSVRRARRLLRATSQTDASASRVQGMLARTYWMEWKLRTGRDEAALTAARSHARLALQTPLHSYSAHQELGMIELHRGQYQLALEHLSLAREQNPFDSRLLSDFAFALVGNGRAKEALALINAERAADCRSGGFRNWVIASSHYALEEYEPAVAALLEFGTHGPNCRAVPRATPCLANTRKPRNTPTSI